ncbi:hypothetical protein CLIB1423_12S03334 [[Candida] railenensis]|uniref:Uncharacterized protein n=1 Tax=[Candida] railenensis TaxID=45579 RepID=A0A9P0QQT4_9ASCO|nr:hypothetical protein CLIB1423_12S03334 [[Candida] railenensis]
MAGKKRKNEYVDPFKAFEMEREANTQRLLKDRKLVINRGATAANSGTTPETLVGKSRNTSSRNQQPQPQHKQPIDSSSSGCKTPTDESKISMSNIRETIFTLHTNPDASTRPRAPFSEAHAECVNPTINPTGRKEKTRIGVQKLGSLIRKSEISKAASKTGAHARVNHFIEQLLFHFSFSEAQSVTKYLVYSNIYRLIAWFKNNRFEFINVHDNIDDLRDAAQYKLMAPEMRPRLETSLKNLLAKATEKTDNGENTIISRVLNMRYIPKDLRRNKEEAPPTHIVEGAKRVGIYMVGAKLKDIQTKESLAVLLMKPGSRINFLVGDLLSLPDKPKYTQLIDEKEFPVYLTFQIFREPSSNH